MSSKFNRSPFLILFIISVPYLTMWRKWRLAGGAIKNSRRGLLCCKIFFFFGGGGYEERISLRDCGAARIVNRILNTETNLKINSNILKRAHLRYYSRLAMKIYSKRNLTVRISIKDYRARAMDKWWGRRRP